MSSSWYSGSLLGQNTQKNPGTWSDIAASYAQELTANLRRELTTGFAALTLSPLDDKLIATSSETVANPPANPRRPGGKYRESRRSRRFPTMRAIHWGQ